MKSDIQLFDLHVHTLGHGLNKSPKVEETVKAAINHGLAAICLTDHFPLPDEFIDPTAEKDCAMKMSFYQSYTEEIERVREKYSMQIKVLFGAEFDWLPDYQSWIKKQIDSYQFDFIIGSVHFLGEISDKRGKRNFILDYRESEFLQGIEYYGGVRQFVRKYYQQVQTMVRTGFFDCVAHIDLVKKYNNGNLFSEDDSWYKTIVSETLDLVKNENMIVEINTSGFDKKCRKQYPSLWILKKARRRKIAITIGSDGHTQETVGKNIDKAINLAREAGYSSLVRFQRRQKITIDIKRFSD